MRDDVTFEARLADALGRYAELAPTMDDTAVARQAIATGGASRRTGWLAPLRRGAPDRATAGRTRLRVSVLFIVVALVLAAIVVAIAGGVLRRSSVPILGRNGPIAFTVQGNNHGPASTHIVNADGTGDHPVDADRCPSYSNDGSVLAAVSYEGSAYLNVWDPDGKPTARLLLVEAPPTSVSFALSPDGTQVAWIQPSLSVATDSAGLWVAPIDGGPALRIVPRSAVPDEVYQSPIWSPDGGHLAFGSYSRDAATGVRQRSAISVVAVDGSDLLRLSTRPTGLDDEMSWSADGRFLVYVGLPDGATQSPSASVAPAPVDPPGDIFVVAVDGAGERNLTNSSADEGQPAWSPDGAVLAFETSAEGVAHRLTTIHMNGPTPVGQPVIGPVSEWFVWSPDGTELLWLEATTVSAETYRSTINAINPDFLEPPRTVQTVDGLIVCAPSWQRLDP